MKKLNELLPCNYDIEIKGIADDSRDVHEGYLFVATKGFNVDHANYIDEAISRGAAAVVSMVDKDLAVPLVVVDNINDVYRELCWKFFDVDYDKLSLIGITGTDGKTTTASIVRELLNDLIPTAYLGTNGLEVLNEIYTTNNTTPGGFELAKCFSEIEKRDVSSLVMEVSSEALLHKRVVDLAYDIVAITNITEDHLNIHGSIENYIKCKLDILNYVKNDGVVIVNGDDFNSQKVSGDNVYKFGFSKNNDYIIEDVSLLPMTTFKIRNNDNVYVIISPLKGLYNVYNVALAFIICLKKGVGADKLIEKIRHLNCVNGRGEELNFGQDFTIVLDYAHTYNAIKNILDVYRPLYKEMIVVTGAAGGREKEKRAKIGALVLDVCDIAIFTMDDPRYEDVGEIIDDLLSSTSGTNYLRINDRVLAIKKAFCLADKDTVVLILGKGRDNYMAIEDKKIKYSDYEVIRDYFI